MDTNFIMRLIMSILLSGFAAFLANRGVAVFNDGLRPMVPEYLEGRMDRKALAATSFALGFGLVIGFGIPFSIGSTIILIHSILLGTDIIGVSTPDTNNGAIAATIIGAAYGAGLVIGLDIVVNLFTKLPVNFLPELELVGRPIIVAFAVFPALVVGYQYGFKKGLITFTITFLVRQIIAVFGVIKINEASSIKLNADGMALLVGILIMLFFAIKDKSHEKTNSNEMLVGIFSERIARVKKNIFVLAIMGGLISAACSLRLVAGDPISLELLKDPSKASEAGIVALARSIGFVPLVATTAITTGVYGPAGMTLVFAVGIFVSLFITNPVIALIVAFILGALVIVAEVYLLESIAKMLDKFPGIKACGDQIRTAMTKVLEVALLVGGMVAADKMSGGTGLGYLFVAGLYLLNKTAKKPLVDMAVGPVAAILFGIVLNILNVLHLFTPVIAK